MCAVGKWGERVPGEGGLGSCWTSERLYSDRKSCVGFRPVPHIFLFFYKREEHKTFSVLLFRNVSQLYRRNKNWKTKTFVPKIPSVLLGRGWGYSIHGAKIRFPMWFFSGNSTELRKDVLPKSNSQGDLSEFSFKW